VLDELATLFGPQARTPRAFHDTRWTNEPWTRGCPVAIAGPGTLLAYGDRTRPPQGRTHFAGTETSTYGNGYMWTAPCAQASAPPKSSKPKGPGPLGAV
jgi:monoamine oxidase